MRQVPVLILAGSRSGEEDVLAKAASVSHKALLPVVGIPMIERVYQALGQSGIASEIYIASETDRWIKDSHLEGVKFFQSSPTLPGTIYQALLKIGFPCFIVTADHALLCAEWIREFFEKSQNTDADLTVGVAFKEKIDRLPLERPRTYIKLSDMQFSGCNLFFLKNPSSKNIIALWEKIYQFRKSPLKMVRRLGIIFLFKAFFRKLDSKSLLAKITALTGASLAFIPLEDGRAAIDIDTVSDWKLVEALLTNQHE